MTLTVLPVPNYRHQRSQDTIDILKDLLARAETGEVQEIAVAWVNNRGETANVRSCSEDLSRLLGSITIMQYRLTKDIYDNGENVTRELDDPPEAS